MAGSNTPISVLAGGKNTPELEKEGVLTFRHCDNCRFHTTNPDQCRHNPPTAINAGSSAFPIVDPKWRCGKHTLSVWKFVRNLFRRT